MNDKIDRPARADTEGMSKNKKKIKLSVINVRYSKTCLKRQLKTKAKIWCSNRLSLNAGQKYCKREHSAILSTFIKLPFVFKTFVLSIFEWPLKTGFTVYFILKWKNAYFILPFLKVQIGVSFA